MNLHRFVRENIGPMEVDAFFGMELAFGLDRNPIISLMRKPVEGSRIVESTDSPEIQEIALLNLAMTETDLHDAIDSLSMDDPSWLVQQFLEAADMAE